MELLWSNTDKILTAMGVGKTDACNWLNYILSECVGGRRVIRAWIAFPDLQVKASVQSLGDMCRG